jgi:AraC-like DNA-binding protein
LADLPKVRNVVAQQVCRELKEARIDAEPLLYEAGLQFSQIIQDDGWIPYVNHARLLEVGARKLRNLHLGLDTVHKTDPRDLGALTYVGLSSKTLEDALMNCKRYLKVLTEAWSFDFIKKDRTATLRFTPARKAFEQYPQATEAGIGLFIHVYQFFLSKPLDPLEVGFVHEMVPSKKQTRYERRLGCTVKFGQKYNQITLDRTALIHPIGTADDRLLKILRTHCEQTLKEQNLRQSDLVTLIRNTIAYLLSSGRAKAKEVAVELGMTERTLHRRLAEEGTTFGEIHEKLCSSLANKYIREKNLSLQQVAFLLGYSNQSAFGVAFKRWTGNTPKVVRTLSRRTSSSYF